MTTAGELRPEDRFAVGMVDGVVKGVHVSMSSSDRVRIMFRDRRGRTQHAWLQADQPVDIVPGWETIGDRAQLCQTSGVTLDGRPARISGHTLPFAMVRPVPSELAGGVEFAWETVARVVAAGGGFRS